MIVEEIRCCEALWRMVKKITVEADKKSVMVKLKIPFRLSDIKNLFRRLSSKTR